MNIYEVLKHLFRSRKQWTILQSPKGLDGDMGYREVQFLLTEKQEGFGGRKVESFQMRGKEVHWNDVSGAVWR